MFRTSLMFLAALCFAVPAFAGDKDAPKKDQTVQQEKPKPYPLTTCIVSHEALGGEMGKPVEIDYKGQTIKFCCKGCIKKFNAKPEKYLKALEEAEAKAKAATTNEKKDAAK